MQKPRNQPIGVCLVSTTWLILSVTESKVCPGAMTGGVRASSQQAARSTSCGRPVRPGGPSGCVPASPSGAAAVRPVPARVFGFRTTAR